VRNTFASIKENSAIEANVARHRRNTPVSSTTRTPHGRDEGRWSQDVPIFGATRLGEHNVTLARDHLMLIDVKLLTC
jgi:hypothetical protein